MRQHILSLRLSDAEIADLRAEAAAADRSINYVARARLFGPIEQAGSVGGASADAAIGVDSAAPPDSKEKP